MSASLNGITPQLRPYFAELLRRFPRMVVTSTYRSYTEQLRLWNNRANNPYPVAPPGRSYHERRRAMDVDADPATLRAAGAVWESWGGTWGGRFKDPIHFQA